MTQTFVSSQQCPWVLIRVQGNGQPGRRPPTSVAWLEYKNPDGTFDGGPVWYSPRKRRWFFTYKRQQKIAPARVLYTFPVPKHMAPTATMVRHAKAALAKIEEIDG